MILLLGLGAIAGTIWHDLSSYHHLTSVGSIVIVIGAMLVVSWIGGLTRFM